MLLKLTVLSWIGPNFPSFEEFLKVEFDVSLLKSI
jgi:hypothetical protein